MVEMATERLAGLPVSPRVGRLEDPLPEGPFDLVLAADRPAD
jgi:hypothetical protein